MRRLRVGAQVRCFCFGDQSFSLHLIYCWGSLTTPANKMSGFKNADSCTTAATEATHSDWNSESTNLDASTSPLAIYYMHAEIRQTASRHPRGAVANAVCDAAVGGSNQSSVVGLPTPREQLVCLEHAPSRGWLNQLTTSEAYRTQASCGRFLAPTVFLASNPLALTGAPRSESGHHRPPSSSTCSGPGCPTTPALDKPV